jgi:hypothetical protein
MMIALATEVVIRISFILLGVPVPHGISIIQEILLLAVPVDLQEILAVADTAQIVMVGST